MTVNLQVSLVRQPVGQSLEQIFCWYYVFMITKCYKLLQKCHMLLQSVKVLQKCQILLQGVTNVSNVVKSVTKVSNVVTKCYKVLYKCQMLLQSVTKV